MVEFNELKITPKGDKLIIDVSVKNIDNNENVFINTIIIDNQKTFISTGPSSNPIFIYNPNDLQLSKEKVKHVRLELSSKLLEKTNLNTDLFFIYIILEGAENNTIGIAFNKYKLQDIGMHYIKEVCNCCEIPNNFIDYILKIKAFELSLQTGNYLQAIKYWNKFFSIQLNNFSNCNCHGYQN